MSLNTMRFVINRDIRTTMGMVTQERLYSVVIRTENTT